ncbi:MAG: hypothetical protein IPK79_03745 [Vampirovibrionales bacterium]|nr:hypothetical protein [Vampirovibrionales bacterium]
MTTVFVSGSRHITRLNPLIRQRLQNITAQRLRIVVGDANGADKAFQAFFKEEGYKLVTVYCAGPHCRNNLGGWEIVRVEVASHLKGRDFYVQKDIAMAGIADYGLVLWDGKSAGSIGNIFELARQSKPTRVYFAPLKEFIEIRTIAEAQGLLKKCAPADVSAISKKLKIPKLGLSTEEDGQQIALAI